MRPEPLSYYSVYQKYHLKTLVSLDDWVDRLSYRYSFYALLGFTILVTSGTYLFRPIACHMPTAPKGANFKSYVESACWVLGTLPIRSNETLPFNVEEIQKLAEERRINYYQWVPFVLGLQAILFYLPNVLWQAMSTHRLGTDLNVLVNNAHHALRAETDDKHVKSIEQVARSMELLLFAHRDYRHGVMKDFQRACLRTIGPCFMSKRFGTWIVYSYLVVKTLYLANTILQLYMMKYLLQYPQNFIEFGFNLLHALLQHREWTETLFFPRKAYCSVTLRHLGTKGTIYLGVCALPINMLNEKIYIFLYFWISFVMVLTAISIPLWFLRVCSQYHRTNLVHKYLAVHPPHRTHDDQGSSDGASSVEGSKLTPHSIDPTIRANVNRFVVEFLRADGVFLLHILTMNVGDMVTSEIVSLLWIAWEVRSVDRNLDHDMPMRPIPEHEVYDKLGSDSQNLNGSLLSSTSPDLRKRTN